MTKDEHQAITEAYLRSVFGERMDYLEDAEISIAREAHKQALLTAQVEIDRLQQRLDWFDEHLKD